MSAVVTPRPGFAVPSKVSTLLAGCICEDLADLSPGPLQLHSFTCGDLCRTDQDKVIRPVLCLPTWGGDRECVHRTVGGRGSPRRDLSKSLTMKRRSETVKSSKRDLGADCVQ